MILEAKGVVAGYGDVQVLWGTDVHVGAREIVALIGSNGAGKSTLLKCLSGLVRPGAGQITIHGVPLAGGAPKDFLLAGVAHVPEGRRLFRGMSVQENLLLGAYLRTDKASIRRDLGYVYSLFPILEKRKGQDASTLSGGEQQMCAIGRGIMARPRLLLIDELSLGLAPRVVDDLVLVLQQIVQQDISILLVEQDVSTALEIASRGYVLERGKVAASGSSDDLLRSPIIENSYLGTV